jgi:hypothetical protein
MWNCSSKISLVLYKFHGPVRTEKIMFVNIVKSRIVHFKLTCFNFHYSSPCVHIDDATLPTCKVSSLKGRRIFSCFVFTKITPSGAYASGNLVPRRTFFKNSRLAMIFGPNLSSQNCAKCISHPAQKPGNEVFNLHSLIQFYEILIDRTLMS